jgi:protein-glutamine gamma-glutamyltransferase
MGFDMNPAQPWMAGRLALSTLTREARDTLWLLAMLTLVLLPHAPQLPWWCLLSAGTALLWRARLAWTDAGLPPRWVLALLLVATLIMTWLTHRTLIGREAGITLIVILTTLKCLELRARRDSLVCLYLGFFLVLTQFFEDQGIGAALLMLLSVWGLLTSLVLGQRPLGRPSIRHAGQEALRAMLYGLPLMVVLFLLFPRLGPLWSLPRDAQSRTGLSDQLTLGQVAELVQDSTVALRVTFKGEPPLTSSLYFRGPTLDQFDGRQWRPAPPLLGWRPDYTLSGRPVAYQMTLEPQPMNVVPLLDGTGQARMTAGHQGPRLFRQGAQWVSTALLDQRTQVDGVFWPHAHEGPLENSVWLREWIDLPAGFNPRTLAWAASLRQRPDLASADAVTLAGAVLQHIRSAGFQYTLSPGLSDSPSTPHLVDEFWLDRKSGFCEHFASSFVVIMRAMDVPSRVVVGYQGAELNPVDGQYIVRNSNAHAWAEIWQPGVGWVRVDPTAAAAPDRLAWTPGPSALSGLPGPLGKLAPDTLRHLRDQWDAVNHRWNLWVLQYSQNEQMNLLRSMGWNTPNWAALGQTLGSALALIGLGAGLVVWWTRDRARPSAWFVLHQRVHEALSTLGLPQPAGASPASASSWLRVLPADGEMLPPGMTLAQIETLRSQLRQLDALQYGPVPADKPHRQADAMRIARALVRQVEHRCRQRASNRHQAGANFTN